MLPKLQALNVDYLKFKDLSQHFEESEEYKSKRRMIKELRIIEDEIQQLIQHARSR